MINERIPRRFETKYIDRFKIVRWTVCGEEHFTVTERINDAIYGLCYSRPKFFKSAAEVKDWVKYGS